MRSALLLGAIAPSPEAVRVPARPRVGVAVVTFARPRYLARCLADVAARDGREAAAATGGSRFAKEKLQSVVAELAAKRRRLRAIGWQVPLFAAAGACDATRTHLEL